MKYRRAKRLQHPSAVDPDYLRELIDEKLNRLGYRESRRTYSLAGDLEMIYSESIKSIDRLNFLIQSSPNDLAALQEAISDLRVGIDHLRWHARRSARPLLRLHEHLISLEDETED